MNDIEYNHPIFLNDRVLSNDFHHVWSILAYSDTWFSRHHQRVAMRFHYASLTPTKIKNRKIFGLGMHLKKNPTKIMEWYKQYGGDLIHISFGDLIKNLDSDFEILIQESSPNKNGLSLVYRKTLPDGTLTKLKGTISGIEKYLSGVSCERPN